MSLTTLNHKAYAFWHQVNPSALTEAAVRDLESCVMPHVDFLPQKINETLPLRANEQTPNLRQGSR